MQIDVVIQFSAEDKKILKDALLPIRLVDSTEFQVKAAVAGRVIDNKNIEVDSAMEFLGVLSHLKMSIQKETDCKADPEWIKRTEQAVADGETPITRHPEQAVALLCDIRKGQLEDTDKAITVTQGAIDHALAARSRISDINSRNKTDGVAGQD